MPVGVLQKVALMNSPEHSDASEFSSSDRGSTGLLLSRDLIFMTKIRATAAELGYEIQVAQENALAKSLIAELQPRIVLLDLTAGDLCVPSAIKAYRQLASTPTWFVAFGPHVDSNALAAAKSAGCQVTLPRSKLAADLPALIRRYFSVPARQSADG